MFCFPFLGLSSTISPYMNLMWCTGVSSEVSCSMNISSAFNSLSFAIPAVKFNSAYFYTVVLYTFPRENFKKMPVILTITILIFNLVATYFVPDTLGKDYLGDLRYFGKIYIGKPITWMRSLRIAEVKRSSKATQLERYVTESSVLFYSKSNDL